ncbi:MAG: methylmalonyl-CoA mutase [SAR202 cluster bacterium]|nr:methylmalonyl-CoA mutase [SAR202 cluster bacterium]|tara:strand:- start:12995 stop:13411 length:417 start_codon:yes stop_codon:yes gene_type:complete
MNKSINILIGKPGLDGHDRGAKIVARILEDEGFNVYFSGIRKTPLEIALLAKDENVDLIGLSILSGAHMELVPEVIACLQSLGLENIPIILGGIIPPQDRSNLLEMGVAAIFNPGSNSTEIVTRIREILNNKTQQNIN